MELSFLMWCLFLKEYIEKVQNILHQKGVSDKAQSLPPQNEANILAYFATKMEVLHMQEDIADRQKEIAMSQQPQEPITGNDIYWSKQRKDGVMGVSIISVFLLVVYFFTARFIGLGGLLVLLLLLALFWWSVLRKASYQKKENATAQQVIQQPTQAIPPPTVALAPGVLTPEQPTTQADSSSSSATTPPMKIQTPVGTRTPTAQPTSNSEDEDDFENWSSDEKIVALQVLLSKPEYANKTKAEKLALILKMAIPPGSDFFMYAHAVESLLSWEVVMAKSDKDLGLFSDITLLVLAHNRQELLSKLEMLAENYPTARDFYNSFLQRAADLLPATSVAETSLEDLPATQIPHKEAEMVIYCIHCGTQLPDSASFCLKCGKSVKGTAMATAQAESRWEYCEIVCKEAGFLGSKSYFAAQAVGSKGRYEAARSTKTIRTVPAYEGVTLDTHSWGSEKKAKEALDEIMAMLTTDGWELTGEKGEWWEYKYRRRERS